jgi:AraC-like DNA-binding protein
VSKGGSVEKAVKRREGEIIYIEHVKRYVSSEFKLDRVGYIDKKNYEINRHFDALSIQFILSGSGYLEMDRRIYALEAPVMTINYPGESKRYGPHDTWEELYFGFPASSEPYLRPRLQAIAPHQPFYRLNDISLFMNYFDIVRELMGKPNNEGVADQLDQLANILVLEALHPSRLESDSPKERLFKEVVHWINLNFQTDIDLKKIVVDKGLSYSTFQRLWRSKFKISPIQYIQSLRNYEAKKLLLKSGMSVKEVARKVGFDNQFYFSNFFRKHNGVSPTQFKKRSVNEICSENLPEDREDQARTR